MALDDIVGKFWLCQGDACSSTIPAMDRHVELGYGSFPLTPTLSLGEREVRIPSLEHA